MSVDLSDEDIYPAYERVLQGDDDWLLLKYSTRDKLFLCDIGIGGVEDIKSKLQNDVYFVFLRFRDEAISAPCYILFSYVPDGTSGVKRARALVHGRAVAGLLKAHQVLLNFTSASQLSQKEFALRIAEDQQSPPPSATSSNFNPLPPFNRPYQHEEPPQKQVTTQAHRSGTSFVQPTMGLAHRSYDEHADLPPPTPPKPYIRSQAPTSLLSSTAMSPPPRRTASETIPRFESSDRYATLDSMISRTQSEFRPRSKSTNVRRVGGNTAVPVDEDPEVKARLKAEIKRLRELAEREMADAEAEANRAPRVAKSHLVISDPYEEKARRYEEEKEKQRRIAVRLLREQTRREQEEQEEQERLQKLQIERDKRLQTARIAQQKRERDERERLNLAKREAEEQSVKKAAMKANLANVHLQLTSGRDMKGLVQEDYISVQPPDSISWKRRYYELTKNSLTLYKDEKKLKALESMPIAGRIAGIKQWDEGFEELRSIPYSFAVVFRDTEPPWLFYADTEQQMAVLAGLLSGL